MNRRMLLWLAVVALLLQAMIPAGMMPDFAAKALSLNLVLCDGAMPAAVGMPDMKMPGQHRDHDHRKMTPCPFALAVLELWVVAAIIIALFRSTTQRVQLRSPESFVLARRPFGNASPRAPPFLSMI